MDNPPIKNLPVVLKETRNLAECPADTPGDHMTEQKLTMHHNAWPSTRVLLLDRMAASPDNQAWREFTELYMPIVYRFCRRRNLQDADAEEVTQNVFANILRAMHDFQYDIGRGRFRSWLCTIVHREVLRHHAKDQRRVRAAGAGAGDAQCNATRSEFETAWCDVFYAGIYAAALQRVQPQFDSETWRAFVLAWEEHVPSAEVAQILGKDVNWVYKAKFRVHKALQAVVLALADDEPALHY
jgi:RNA polymerase sigma-70 factor (ECF subfamily)